jgi:tetratricopeptide (TPR) repeat protein
MSNSTVVSRKDMKEPDKFQAAAGQAATWVAGHRNPVVAAIAGAAALIVLVSVVSVWQSHRAEASGAALSEVLRVAGGEITAVPLPGLPGPFFKDEAERHRAVLEASRAVRESYAGSDAATQATLLAGDAHLGLKEWDAAVGAYNDYLTNADANDPLRFGALEGMAMAEEGRGKLDAAAATYDRLAKEVPFYADRAELERARVLAASGQVDDARKLLEGFAEKHAASPLVGDAAERLARMGGK